MKIFKRCPQCGYEAPRESKPYEYVGGLKPLVPLILDRLRAGASIASIAKEISTPTANVAYIASRYNLRPRKEKRDPSQLAKDYAEGNITLRELAERENTSREYVRQLIARHKYQTSERAERQRIIASTERLEDLPIYALNLSVRAQNALLNNDITTIGQLEKYSDSQLLRTPNFGKRSLEEIRLALAAIRKLYEG